MIMRLPLIFFILIALLTLSTSVSAATVSGQIRFWDNREDRGGTSTNHRLSSYSAGNAPLPNAFVYLYDQDGTCIDYESDCSENDDDFLASTTANSSGYYSFSGIGTAEDIYILSRFQAYDGVYLEVRGIAYGSPIQVISHSSVHWNIGGNLTINFNITCPETAGNCPNQTYVDQNTAYNAEERSNILASMLDVVRWGGNLSYNGHTTLYGYFPDGPFSGACSGLAGRATGYNDFCISYSNGLENQVVAHEIGHLVHKRLLNDGSGALNGGSNCGGWASMNDEKCAVSEGWAEFYSAAVYWPPSAWNAYIDEENTWKTLEGLTTSGNSGVWKECVWESSAPCCAQGNVARWFWDLYDSTTLNDGGNDNAQYSLSFIKSVWDEFPGGTSNRKASESDDDGRNAYDVVYYEYGFQSELYQNCLTKQDTN